MISVLGEYCDLAGVEESSPVELVREAEVPIASHKYVATSDRFQGLET